MAKLRRITQIVTFALFIVLLIHAAAMARAAFAVPPELFLRFSPLAAAATMLGAKAWIWRYVPALVVLIVAIAFGRIFCGWICPLGSTLDAADKALTRARKGRKPSLYDGRRPKYYLLAFLLIGAPLGITAAGWFDPISIATRTYGTAVVPYIVWLSNGIGLGLQDLPAGPLGTWWGSASRTVLADGAAANYHYHAVFVLLFLGILGLGVWLPRYWCRDLCPLGALLGLVSGRNLLRRSVSDKCISCHKCERTCPMGCITDDGHGTQAGECIVCLRCQDACPTDAIRFLRTQPAGQDVAVDLTKRGFLTTLGAAAVALPALRINTERHRQKQRMTVLRPPGARDEDEFLSRCVRCGECMRVCPMRALQPCGLEAGVEGLWTPRLVPRMGYCDYNCTLCGQVCPSQAIEKLTLEEKRQRAPGKAAFNRSRCIPWRAHARFREDLGEWKDANCGTCEEACPVPGKAIHYTRFVGEINGETIHIDRPYVVEDRCVGCGFCENVCPVAGDAAVRVEGPAGIARIPEDISAAAPAFDIAAAFPAEIAGWTLGGKPGVYVGGKELYDLIDGAGEPYLTYAFVQLAEAKYVKGKMELAARIWQFATPAEAFGGYSYEVTRGAQKPETLGAAAARSATELWVWSSTAFIHLADYGQDAAPADAFATVAKGMLPQLPKGESTRPAVVAALPTASLIATSIAYFHNEDLAVPDALPSDLAGAKALAISKNTPAVFAAYGTPDETTHRVVAVDYPNEAAALAALERIAALRRGKPVAATVEDAAIVRPQEGSFEAFVRHKARVGGVVAAKSLEVATAAIAQLKVSLAK